MAVVLVYFVSKTFVPSFAMSGRLAVVGVNGQLFMVTNFEIV